MKQPEEAEPLIFGAEHEYEYRGHITPAAHLVPLPRRCYGSADETHIRIWGPAGDIAKTTFPSNRRSMVSAMVFCPTFSALLTTEVDMTLKAYTIEKLELLESFSLEQARKKADREGAGQGNEKVSALVYLQTQQWVLVGGDQGCELWRLAKSGKRRAVAVGRSEYHLELEPLGQVSRDPVLNISTQPAEQRVIIWGPGSLHVHDMELTLLTSCQRPHAGPVCSACIHVLSPLASELLTGGADGAVNYWSIQAMSEPMEVDAGDVMETVEVPAIQQGKTEQGPAPRLEHGFLGHSRSVEMVCFYHRLERGIRQRLCVSCGRDGKMKVWSLEHFSLVYSLDLAFIDPKAFIFPLSPHFFAVSSSQTSNAEDGVGQSATVTIVRFTAQLATPFACTNQSHVMQINNPPASSSTEQASRLANCATLVTEDMAVHVLDSEVSRIISTLPPPPNSKVQVLRAFVCCPWQLLILWLSSQEIAIFFVPSPSSAEEPSDEVAENARRAESAATPLLLRRFGVLEVRARSLDKDLARERFCSAALHYGSPPEALDRLLPGGFFAEDSDGLGRETTPDWFLFIGTLMGTLQAFRLRDILSDLPIWERLAAVLPAGAWRPRRRVPVRDTGQLLSGGAGKAESHLHNIELEHLEAMELARPAGQRPFPRGAPPLTLYGRWRCHDYQIKTTESSGHRLWTMDMKHFVKVWRLTDMTCTCRVQLGDFECYTTYLQAGADYPAAHEEAKAPSEAPMLAGLALGTSAGSLQLQPLVPNMQGDREVFQSVASHADAVTQIDFVLAVNIFVSIGRDDAIKIWSRRLSLLREVFFPSPLTSVAFRRRHGSAGSRPDMSGRVHGDILVGFAAHVERIAFSVWSRGVPDELFNVMRAGHAMSVHDVDETRSRSYKRQQRVAALSDDIEDYAAFLHLSQPQARSPVALITGGMMQGRSRAEASDNEMDNIARDDLALERFRCGLVMDFRGPALFEVATLSGQTADWAALELAKWPSKEPNVEHQRSAVLGKGAFRAITRRFPGYYDWTVNPNTIVDAPRETAIRGTIGAGNVALVTSIGIGHLRQLGKDMFANKANTDEDQDQPDGPASARPQKPVRPPGEGRRRLGRSRQTSGSPQPRLDAVAAPTPTPRQRSPELTSALPGRSRPRGMNVTASDGSAWAADQDGLSGGPRPRAGSNVSEDECCGWRVGRGVPKNENAAKPRTQSMANTVDDAAKLLRGRGHLVEAPDPPEANILKSLFAQKADWLYCPPGSRVLAARRSVIESHLEARSRTVATWTPAGRLVSNEHQAPRQAVPESALLSLPLPHMKLRTPMTRAEVTEQRLIEAAMRGPPRQPRFVVESQDSGRRGRQVPTPPPGALPQEDSSLLRSGHSGSRISASSDWRAMMPLDKHYEKAPLTAR